MRIMTITIKGEIFFFVDDKLKQKIKEAIINILKRHSQANDANFSPQIEFIQGETPKSNSLNLIAVINGSENFDAESILKEINKMDELYPPYKDSHMQASQKTVKFHAEDMSKPRICMGFLYVTTEKAA